MKIKKIISLILVSAFIVTAFVPFASASTKKKNYLVLGDSIGYADGIRNPKKAAYGVYVADSEGFSYQNDAICGHTSFDMIEDIKNEKVRGHIGEADIISISIGGNDFLLGDIVSILSQSMLYDKYEPIDKTIDQYVENLDIIIKDIFSINPNAKILLQTLYNPRYDDIRETYQQAVNRFNKAIKTYCSNHYHVYCVDIEGDFFEHKDYIAADGIHPNSKGNEVIAKVIIDKLYSLGLGTAKELVISTKGFDLPLPNPTNIMITIVGRMFSLARKIIDLKNK